MCKFDHDIEITTNHKKRKSTTMLFGVSPFCFALYLQYLYEPKAKITKMERLILPTIILVLLLPASSELARRMERNSPPTEYLIVSISS
jgi:hypothetical protein